MANLKSVQAFVHMNQTLSWNSKANTQAKSRKALKKQSTHLIYSVGPSPKHSIVACHVTDTQEASADPSSQSWRWGGVNGAHSLDTDSSRMSG